jgi:hypothetical protein
MAKLLVQQVKRILLLIGIAARLIPTEIARKPDKIKVQIIRTDAKKKYTGTSHDAINRKVPYEKY